MNRVAQDQTWNRDPFLRQWLSMLVLLGASLVLAIVFQWFWRQDLLLYDAQLSGGPAPSNVVIVAIDDASLQQIGRWPWPRALHAALLERLREAHARAVALDLVLTEASGEGWQQDQNARTRDTRSDDERLAAAMRRGPPTVLPMMVDWNHPGGPPSEILPAEPLASAAAGIGHAHLEIDQDGIARSVFLREGPGRATRSQLALALLETDPAWRHIRLPGQRAPTPPDPDAWVRDYHLLIPFLGPPGHITRVSYVDVLKGRVPLEALRDKWVLVGATAQGLGDAYPTPRSGHGVSMPGVEISANILAALLTGRSITPMPQLAVILLSLLPLGVGFAGFLRLSPRHSLLLILALSGMTLLAGYLLLRFAQLWFPPATALAALVAAYPLWSWRRLEATQQFLDQELAQLEREPLPIEPVRSRPGRQRVLHDTLQGRIDRARDASARLRHLRQLLGDTIASLPDATMLIDSQGHIELANHAAAELFDAGSLQALQGTPVQRLLDPLLEPAGEDFASLAQRAPASTEFQDRRARTLMLRISPFRDTQGMHRGSVLDIADITAVKNAERERDDMIRFLSHDLRSPSSSLIGMARLLRDPRHAMSLERAAERIEHLAGRTLAMAEGFIALARARYISPARFEPLDLRDAIQDALDEVWASATARDMKIRAGGMEREAPIRGNREMLARATSNLLNNAIKYSPPGTKVELNLEHQGDSWRISVRDQGPGIAPDRHGELFQHFRRGMSAGEDDPGGAGLGLAFVRAVAQKHGGSVGVSSTAGAGATFELRVPAAPA